MYMCVCMCVCVCVTPHRLWQWWLPSTRWTSCGHSYAHIWHQRSLSSCLHVNRCAAKHTHTHTHTDTRTDQDSVRDRLKDVRLRSLSFKCVLDPHSQVRFVYEAFRKLRPGISLRALHGGMKQMKRMVVFQDFCTVRSHTHTYTHTHTPSLAALHA